MADHEQVIVAVVALVEAALPGANVVRNRSELTRVGAGGAVSVMDGDIGDPEVDLGLGHPIYNYSRAIPLIFAPGPATTLANMHRAVGAAVEADRTLGGLIEYLQTIAPDTEPLDVQGADPSAQSEAALIADYTTTSPL